MNNRRYRHRLLALSASILLGLSGLSSSAVDAAEVTVEQPAADTTVSQDTGNPSADTKEAAEGQTEGETTEPERIEPDAYFEPIQSNDTANWPQGPAVWAESAVVMDLDSGTFLYSKNMDVAKYPASITKILTTLIAIEHSRPSEKVTFSENAVYGIEQGSSNIGIRLGENLTMEDCLYGMMLESANEVCVAVAEHISGSVDAFVELMNQKAASLGCTNTHFTNPNGLPDENHYTTAHDMALIMREGLKNKKFRKIIGATDYVIEPTNKNSESRVLHTHHPMLAPESGYYYKGCIGGKTGYTSAAGNTLVTAARRNGTTYITVTMKAADLAIASSDSTAMFNYGYQNFQKMQADGGEILIPNGVTVDNLTVREGTLDGNPVNQYFFGDYMVGSVPVPEATPTPEPSVEEVAEKDLENTEDGKQTDISESADKEIQESGEKTEVSGEILQLRKVLLITGAAMLLLLIILLAAQIRKKKKEEQHRRNKKTDK